METGKTGEGLGEAGQGRCRESAKVEVSGDERAKTRLAPRFLPNIAYRPSQAHPRS